MHHLHEYSKARDLHGRDRPEQSLPPESQTNYPDSQRSAGICNATRSGIDPLRDAQSKEVETTNAEGNDDS